MHDPDTQAFVIRYPWWTRNGFDGSRYHSPFITIWHHDPERDGTDDSCGWFKRARHGDKAVLAKIVKRFEWDWDRVFTSDSGNVYYTGLFYPEDAGQGMPNMSVLGIALNLFFLAALEHFGGRKKACRFIQKNLFEILLFGQNPFDSLQDDIIRKFGCDTKRGERIERMASCIYGWILQEERHWLQHPRWHVHHWRLQIHPWQSFKRRWIDRCSRCGKRFKKGQPAIGNWSGTEIWHDACDDTCKLATNPATMVKK